MIFETLKTADKNFKRFANNQPVGLKHVGMVLTVADVIKVCINTSFETPKYDTIIFSS